MRLYGSGVTRTGLPGDGEALAEGVSLTELAGLVVPLLGSGAVAIGGAGCVGNACGGTGNVGAGLSRGQTSALTVAVHKSRATTKTHSRAWLFFNAPPICVDDLEASRVGWVYRPGATPRSCSRSALAFFRASRM